MRLFILAALAASLNAATIVVCSSGCTYPATPAGLQQAITAASCGDTVSVEAGVTFDSSGANAPTYSVANKDCPAGNELTITTAKSDWLPAADEKILPSYLPLIPLLKLSGTTPGQNTAFFKIPELSAGIKVVGVGFKLASQTGPWNFIVLGNDACCPAAPSKTLADLTDRVVFDRVLFKGDFTETQQNTANMFYGNVKDFRLLNSFFTDVYYPQAGSGVEGHVYTTQNSPGPNLFRNNFFSTGYGETTIFGGAPSSIASPQITTANITIEHNSVLHPLKWFKGTPYYVGDSRQACMKNFFEFKQGTDALIRWNQGENNYTNCGSQWHGVTMTIRNQYTQDSGNGVLDEGKRTFTFKPGDSVLVGSEVGIARVANPSYWTPSDWEFHTVVSIGSCNWTTCTVTVDTAYTQAYSSDGKYEDLKSVQVCVPWWSISRVQIYGNFFKNTLAGLNYLGIDDSHRGGGTNDVQFFNNIIANNSPYMNSLPYGLYDSMALIARLSNQGVRPTIANNTYWNGPRNTYPQIAPGLTIEQNGIAGNLTHDLKYMSNLTGPGAGLGGSGSGGADLLNRYTDGTTEVTNNSFAGNGNISGVAGSWPCGATPSQCYAAATPPRVIGRNVFGPNYGPRFVSPEANDFHPNPMQVNICGATNAKPIRVTTCSPHGFSENDTVAISGVTGNTAANGQFAIKNVTGTQFGLTDTSPERKDIQGNGSYSGGGTLKNPYFLGGSDSRDIGADTEQVAAIRYLKVIPGPTELLFSWNLPSVLADKACQLEVSPDEALFSEQGEYTVVNALRPDYFKRADSDRANPRAVKTQDGAWRWFLVGEAVSETGDDGQSHSLVLSADTTYYYRVLCGGAFEQGKIKTLASSTHSGTVNFDIKLKPAVGSKVRARYGSRRSGLTTGSPVGCTGGCTVTIPAQTGTQLIYYLDELNDADQVVFASANPTVIPVF